MTMRYNEADVGNSGGNTILTLDNEGKIPALDGSLLTNIQASGAANGLSYTYTTSNGTNITPNIDTYYYLPNLNKSDALGGSSVNINIPYSNAIINGSKFGFNYIHTNGYANGNKYTLTTPTNAAIAANGWSSFTLNIHGQEFTNGEVYTSDLSAVNSREFYAFVDGTNLTWFAATGGHHYLSDSRLFDINNTTPFSSTKHHMLATKNASTYSTAQGNTNMPNTVFKEFSANTTLSFTDGTLPNGYRHYIITCNNTTGVAPTITLPLAASCEGIFLTFYASFRWSAVGSNYSNFTIARQSTNVIRYLTTGAQATSIAIPQNGRYTLVSEGTNWYVFGGINFYNSLLY
jgi:hypothetical protein